MHLFLGRELLTAFHVGWVISVIIAVRLHFLKIKPSKWNWFDICVHEKNEILCESPALQNAPNSSSWSTLQILLYTLLDSSYIIIFNMLQQFNLNPVNFSAQCNPRCKCEQKPPISYLYSSLFNLYHPSSWSWWRSGFLPAHFCSCSWSPLTIALTELPLLR